MLFLYITGIIGINTNFKIGYCFLFGEQEVNYYFPIKQLYLLYKYLNVNIKVFITDKEIALKNILRLYFHTFFKYSAYST